jgi:hypothetical protein
MWDIDGCCFTINVAHAFILQEMWSCGSDYVFHALFSLDTDKTQKVFNELV